VPAAGQPPDLRSGHLKMTAIGMQFPGVRALDGVDLEARPGELLALMGENGAGKSTLMKILSGVIPHPDYEGQVVLDGVAQAYNGTRAAQAAGVAIIHQELNLFPHLSVAENLFLGQEPLKGWGPFTSIDAIERDRRAQDFLKTSGLGQSWDVRRPLGELSTGQRQLVEIARALLMDAQVLVFDEPTSSLSHGESETLFSILGELRARGKTLLYISHRMEEVFRLADRIAVLRDGKSVWQKPRLECSEESVVAAMVGRPLDQIHPENKRKPGAVRLELKNLKTDKLHDISFSVRAGEVLGVAGLVGSGRSDVLHALFGSLPSQKQVFMEGVELSIESPADAIRAGLAFVTEDRKHDGLLLGRGVDENIELAALPRHSSKMGTLDDAALNELDATYQKKLRIKVSRLDVEVGTLSGGNQQKVVLAKWLALGPRVLLLDEPTRGIDVGARQEIYLLIEELARQGLAIVLVSSDLPEVLGMSDRVLVMRRGAVAGCLDRADANQESVMRLAAGVGGKESQVQA
jgi:ABC-type sugar transport system ATPase subunit